MSVTSRNLIRDALATAPLEIAKGPLGVSIDFKQPGGSEVTIYAIPQFGDTRVTGNLGGETGVYADSLIVPRQDATGTLTGTIVFPPSANVLPGAYIRYPSSTGIKYGIKTIKGNSLGTHYTVTLERYAYSPGID